MKYIDLIEQLSEKDKRKLNNYISKFGIDKEHFIGLDTWLSNWSHSKQMLYRILGNQFIKEFPFTYEKSQAELKKEIIEKLLPMPFAKSFLNFISFLKREKERFDISNYDITSFSFFLSSDTFLNNRIAFSIKYKRPDKNNTLQIQVGTKPIKALNKVVEYFKDVYNFIDFEDFRIAHSMIFNDRCVNGVLCFSIHPLDFATMSDNNLNWTSCMSWITSGCYHQGTVEMMNSNNVICCYLKAKEDFCFGEDSDHKWNNKKWRVLCYVTKDIIMVGKSYPYKNEFINKEILNYMRQMVKETVGWTYSFGPELYQDMIHINNNNQMKTNHIWIKTKSATKHNILFDTKGMYNDMLNDHLTNYWCIRNKVNSNKIISVSGKSTCLCCGGQVIEKNEENDWNEWEDDYNDRFICADTLVCSTCNKKYFYCEECGESNTKIKHFKIKVNNKEMFICKHCYKARVRVCPCCGQIFYVQDHSHIGYVDCLNQNANEKIRKVSRYFITDEVDFIKTESKYPEDWDDNAFPFRCIYLCKDCRNNNNLTLEPRIYKTEFSIFEGNFLVNEKDASKYAINNLDMPMLNIKSGEEILSLIGSK